MVASSGNIPALLEQIDLRRLEPLLQSIGRGRPINLHVGGGGNESGNLGKRAAIAEGRNTADPVALARQQLIAGLVAWHDRSHVTGLGDTLALRLAKLFSMAPAGMRSKLGILSGYRSNERQAQLYADALRTYGSPAAARRWVAPPGQSRHNHGEAADLAYGGQSLRHAPPDVVSWLHANAGRFGLAFPLANENWHVEPVEARRGR